MIALIIILVASTFLLAVITFINRRNKNEEPEIKIEFSEGCCGAHEVCEKDSLLLSNDIIEYFDDEELDELKGISPEKYSDNQIEKLNNVFITLKENEVAAWLKSLQLRCIELPDDIRDQALMIVSERRNAG
jgi:hypothetical protein